MTRFRFNPESVDTVTNVMYKEDHDFMTKSGLSMKLPSEDAALLRCAFCESWWGCGPEITGFLANVEEEISIEKGKHRSCPLNHDVPQNPIFEWDEQDQERYRRQHKKYPVPGPAPEVEQPIMNLAVRCYGDKRRKIIGIAHNKKPYQLRQLMQNMGFAPEEFNGVFQRSDGIILHDGLCFLSQGLTRDKSLIVITVTPNPGYADSERFRRRIHLGKINDMFPMALMELQTDRPLTKSSEMLVHLLTESMEKTRDSRVATSRQRFQARDSLKHMERQIEERRRTHPVRAPVHIGTSLEMFPKGVDEVCPVVVTVGGVKPKRRNKHLMVKKQRSPLRRFLSAMCCGCC